MRDVFDRFQEPSIVEPLDPITSRILYRFEGQPRSAPHSRDSGRALSMKEFLLFSGVIYGSLLAVWVLRKWVPELERHSRLI